MGVKRFLLVAYFIVLAVFQYSDQKTCTDDYNSEAVEHLNMLDHDCATSEFDQCISFCVCACCAAHIQFQHTEISVATFVHNTKTATLYFEKPLLNEEESIWQPPKLA